MGRPLRAEGTVRLTERVAVAQAAEAVPAPVVALRVGCDWADDDYEFAGAVSLLPTEGCGHVSLVAYMSNIGYEGEVGIDWLWEGALMRRSGGSIPKGYAMFVDRMKPGGQGLPQGRWTVKLTDTASGTTIGDRDFVVFPPDEGADDSEVSPAERESRAPDRRAASLMATYQEFFDIGAA